MAKNKRQIVVITDRRDVHVPLVQKYLQDPLIILDPQTLREGGDISFELRRDRMVVTYCGELLDNVVGVWYRKPRDVTASQLNVSADLVGYSLSVMNNHTTMITGAFSDAVWVSNYHKIRRANNKSLQIEEAAKLGFCVPRTLMTSSPERAKNFIESETSCVVKAQVAYSPTPDENNQRSFYTTKVDAKHMPDLANMHLAPSIFQQCIDALFDVRVTVVGDKVFPAIIRNKGLDKNSKIRDWRIGHYEGELIIEPYNNFPKDIARLCVQHNRALGLMFGAIDLVMDRQNKLWFLENNPNGQWGFVEEETGLPIGKELAKILTAI